MFTARQRRWLYLGGIALYLLILYFTVHFESQAAEGNIKTFFDAIWYSFVTLTTVGYGDYYPVTVPGKILGFFYILGSISILGYVLAEFTGKIVKYIEKQKLGMNGTKFKNHFVIIGWNDFASYVADQILQTDGKIAIITNNRNDVDLLNEKYAQKEVFTLFTDFSDLPAFERANITKSSKVWINNGDDSQKLITTVNLKKHYPNLEIALALDSPDLKETFRSVGVTYIVSKNEITSRLLASYLFEPQIALFTEDLMNVAHTKEDYDLLQFAVRDRNPYLNQNYLEAFVNIKKEHNAVLMGLSREINGQHEIMKNPAAGTTIQREDFLLLMSDGVTKQKLEKVFGVKEGMG